MKLVFATGNPGKIREAQEILGAGFEIVPAASLGVTEDIPETGSTLKEKSLQKAQYIFNKTGLDCFADDSGLEVDLLDGAPGVETARYAGAAKDPQANIARLLREMELRGGEPRSARFRTCVTLILGGETHFFDGVMEGRIGREQAGSGGFGYDPIFIPEGFSQTNAELGEEVKNAISHRGKALRKMAGFLRHDK
jgi:XTP/dITP diphosphohydrolase